MSIEKKNKDNIIEANGQIISCLKDGKFEVKLEIQDEETSQILETITGIFTLSGKMRKSQIRVGVGDRVIVELEISSLDKGRIVYRLRKNDTTRPVHGSQASK